MSDNVRFNVSVPARIDAWCTISCGDRNHGDTDHPAKEYQWSATASIMGQRVDFYGGQRWFNTAAAARRDVRKRLNERCRQMREAAA